MTNELSEEEHLDSIICPVVKFENTNDGSRHLTLGFKGEKGTFHDVSKPEFEPTSRQGSNNVTPNSECMVNITRVEGGRTAGKFGSIGFDRNGKPFEVRALNEDAVTQARALLVSAKKKLDKLHIVIHETNIVNYHSLEMELNNVLDLLKEI